MTLPPAALVTGAAKRLGAAMLRRLAAEGFRVVLHYNGSGAEAAALAAEIRAGGDCCAVVAGDLSHRNGVLAVWQQAVAQVGPIGLLVNNASRFENDDLFGATEAALDAHMAVNLKAPLWLTEAMAAQDPLPAGAMVVNMLDNKIAAPNPDFYTYTLSKAALHAATQLGALRLAGRPRICGIAPAITLVSGAQSQAEFERSASINPLRRRVQPKDICDTLLWLWHDSTRNGEVVVLDAGQSLLALPRDVAFLDPEDLPWPNS